MTGFKQDVMVDDYDVITSLKLFQCGVKIESNFTLKGNIVSKKWNI